MHLCAMETVSGVLNRAECCLPCLHPIQFSHQLILASVASNTPFHLKSPPQPSPCSTAKAGCSVISVPLLAPGLSRAVSCLVRTRRPEPLLPSPATPLVLSQPSTLFHFFANSNSSSLPSGASGTGSIRSCNRLLALSAASHGAAQFLSLAVFF